MPRWQWAALAVSLYAIPASGFEPAGVSAVDSLALEELLAEARQNTSVVFGARVDAARGRLDAASVWLHANPTVEARVGTSTHETLGRDVELEWRQPLGLGRGARIASARAGLDGATAGVEDAIRRLDRDVTLAFYRALHADAGVRLAAAAETLAVSVTRIASRRHVAGDVPLLEVELARTAQARAQAESHAARALQASALGTLQVIVGRDRAHPIAPRGDLAEHTVFEAVADSVEQVPAGALAARADLQQLAAAAREASADRSIGDAERWPAIEPGIEYRHESGDDAVFGIVGVELPLFDRGQEQRAVGAARNRELQRTYELELRRSEILLATSLATYRHSAAAAQSLARDAMPAADRNEAMARRAYEAGQINLGELLLLRREWLHTRRDHLDRLLDAAVAGIELQAAARLTHSTPTEARTR